MAQKPKQSSEGKKQTLENKNRPDRKNAGKAGDGKTARVTRAAAAAKGSVVARGGKVAKGSKAAKGGKAAESRKRPAQAKPAQAKAPLPDPFTGGGEKRRQRHALGNLFYTLGFAAECHVMRAGRWLRDFWIFFAQMAAWLLGALWGWIGKGVRSLGRGIAAPFVRFARRRRQLRRIRRHARENREKARVGRLAAFGVSLKTLVQLLANIVGVVMPVAAAAALLFIVYNVVNMNYALAVTVNGQVIGYVSDQSVVESAKGLLRDRIQLAKNQEMEDWQLTPTYTLTRTTSFTTTQQLANQILLNSENPTDLVQATGLYIDGSLYAVTDRGDELRAFLDEKLRYYMQTAPEGATVNFVRDVQCEPASGEVFFASSVVDYDELMQQLQRTVRQEEAVVADGEVSLAEIAGANNLTTEVLRLRNGAYSEATDDYVPEAGERIVLHREEPFLQVKMSFRQQSTEEIPYTTAERENPDLGMGRRNVLQEGQNGLQEVWDDYVYVDGELREVVRANELTVVLAQPVDEIVEVGTYDYSDIYPGGGFGEYVFPVPSSTWSYRGVSSYHNGLDINAPTGQPIIACNAGEVIVAGWHYSFGYNVVIQHPDGLTTRYAHCSSLAVEVGQRVERGQYIAAVGSTGQSTGPHCHLEFRRNGVVLNPLDYVTPPEGYRFGWG